MSRLLIVILVTIWLTQGGSTDSPPGTVIAAYLSGYVAIVVGLAIWNRRIARRIDHLDIDRALGRFNSVVSFTRLLVPAWFAYGVYGEPGWREFVYANLSPHTAWTLLLPAAVVGLAPPILTLMGLWWAQFPADRAIREHTLRAALLADEPIRAPRFWPYFLSHTRLQIFFTLVPIALIMAVRDVAHYCVYLAGKTIEGTVWDGMLLLGSSVLVFVFAPSILRHVLHTQRLPAGPLRMRLESIAARTGLRYRELLVWKTDHAMGNAAVMGLFPRLRYILLTDLLIESLRDEQIEAVFAHEAGHVVHRHMFWYVVLVAILTLASAGVDQLRSLPIVQHLPAWTRSDIAIETGTLFAFFTMFGLVSRRFERQADVFAARTMQAVDPLEAMFAEVSTEGRVGFIPTSLSRSGGNEPHPTHPPSPKPLATPVGPYGAETVAAALYRVASLNGMPLGPLPFRGGSIIATLRHGLSRFMFFITHFIHGTMATRIDYVLFLGHDPKRTTAFDRRMAGVNLTLLAALLLSGIGIMISL